MKLIQNLFKPKQATKERKPVAPKNGLYAIGDIHGRFDLLTKLWDKISDTEHQIIFVGDYIDRGDQSAEVLRFLFEKSTLPNVQCLFGNHEDMMLEFLDKPSTGPRWLRNGGLQTLASFGIGGVSDTAPNDKLVDASQALKEALGPELEAWLRSMPRFYSSGNVFVTHAGMDPNHESHHQSDSTFTWGHKDFLKVDRNDDIWVAHGHYITKTAGSDSKGRIAVDTGAYYSGILTAAEITPDGQVALIQTG